MPGHSCSAARTRTLCNIFIYIYLYGIVPFKCINWLSPYFNGNLCGKITALLAAIAATVAAAAAAANAYEVAKRPARKILASVYVARACGKHIISSVFLVVFAFCFLFAFSATRNFATRY